jgi:hypothetical protein
MCDTYVLVRGRFRAGFEPRRCSEIMSTGIQAGVDGAATDMSVSPGYGSRRTQNEGDRSQQNESARCTSFAPSIYLSNLFYLCSTIYLSAQGLSSLVQGLFRAHSGLFRVHAVGLCRTERID